MNDAFLPTEIKVIGCQKLVQVMCLYCHLLFKISWYEHIQYYGVCKKCILLMENHPV